MPEESLAQRLKERKLAQWSLAYLAGAWAVLEAAGFGAERFGWPELFLQLLTVVAILGFFITLILAWYHGEQSRQRVSGTELLILALLLFLGGLGLRLLAGDREPGPPATDPGEGVESVADALNRLPGIAVLPFDNRSGIPDDCSAPSERPGP